MAAKKLEIGSRELASDSWWGDVFNLAQSMCSESSLARRVKSSSQFTPFASLCKVTQLVMTCATMRAGEEEHVVGSAVNIARGVLKQRSKGTVKLEVVTEVLLCLGNRV